MIRQIIALTLAFGLAISMAENTHAQNNKIQDGTLERVGQMCAHYRVVTSEGIETDFFVRSSNERGMLSQRVGKPVRVHLMWTTCDDDLSQQAWLVTRVKDIDQLPTQDPTGHTVYLPRLHLDKPSKVAQISMAGLAVMYFDCVPHPNCPPCGIDKSIMACPTSQIQDALVKDPNKLLEGNLPGVITGELSTCQTIGGTIYYVLTVRSVRRFEPDERCQ